MSKKLSFLVDVDNTLLNNDLIKLEIKKALDKVLGVEEATHFWRHNNYFREHSNFVNFPYVIKDYCKEVHKETCETTIENIFFNMNFKNALYPDSVKVLKHLKTLGAVSIFTEGDIAYQKCKVENSNLDDLVDHVFIFQYKLEHMDDVMNEIDSKNTKIIYVDDKSSNLEAFKKRYPETHTIRVLQGHYIMDDSQNQYNADESIDCIKRILDKNFN